MSTMLSNYCRPSNRPPEVVDLSTNEQELDDHPKHASPRCTNSDIFLSHHAKNKPANEQANETNQSPRNSPYKDEEETPADVAMLLTSLSPTVSKEIEANPDVTATSIANAFPFPNLAEGSNEGHDGEYEAMDYENLQPSAPLVHFDHKKKTRSVSMDATKAITFGIYTPSPSPPHEEEEVDNTTLLQWRDLRGHSTSPPHAHGIFSTPPPSPHLSSRRKHGMLNRIPTSEYRRSSKDQGTLGHRPRSVSLAEAALVIGMPTLDLTKPGDSTGTDKKVKKLILRKKFSWKNYPELEEFLIANREEYLRHSTLNYTMQQKKYNNCLTTRMISLAEEHGYMFDPTEFSFVTVRDRIRCYYKSYVQSMKKRGVVIGYAAKKAGLITEAELEESAHKSGKIFVPKH